MAKSITLVLALSPWTSVGFITPFSSGCAVRQRNVEHTLSSFAHRRRTPLWIYIHSRRGKHTQRETPHHIQASSTESNPSACIGEDGVRWAEQVFTDCSPVSSTATRLSGLLADVWDILADTSIVESGQARVLLFPDCSAVAEARGLQSVYEHLEVCQDACENFGTKVTIKPHPKGGNSKAPVPALVVQPVSGSGGEEFAYDEDWDGDWDIDRSLLGDNGEHHLDGPLGSEDAETSVMETDLAALSVVPNSDEEIIKLTKTWVQAVITDMGVCPFSVDASRAGLPVGNVRYPVTRQTTAEGVYREYWREVETLISEENERSLSTTLLITPDFTLKNPEAFEVIAQTLTQPLEPLHLEDDIQLVFFHPQYTFRDGRDRLGSEGAANFARRSPFPMINILRTKQVRLAQRSIPTGLVYQQNEDVLTDIGADHLQKMLEARDWRGLRGRKIDRRQAEYHETARKLQGLEVSASTPTDDVGTDDTKSPVPDLIERTRIAEERTEELGPPTNADTDVGTGAAPDTREALTRRPASTSDGISDGDLRQVATSLVKRLGTGVPLKPEAFEEFSRAVDRILEDTAA